MSTDRWVFVQDDGTIILREENDGWQYLRHGPSVGRRQGGSRGGISLGLPHAGRRLARWVFLGLALTARILSTARDDVQRWAKIVSLRHGQAAHLLVGP